MSSPPTAKRIKLEELEIQADLHDIDAATDILGEDERSEEHENTCSICLQTVVDRTVIPGCSHEFCFECLLIWTDQSRRCPLCSQAIGEYLIHSIRSRYDYRKHYLPPLRTSPPPSRPAQSTAVLQNTRNYARRRRREREWGTRARENDEQDKLERSIAKRRWIYRHDLYAKHVASNAFTKYRPYPTPSQFSASQDLISRTTTFLRRELQVWEGLDVEFLTSLILSLMKAIDIRSESAVKLIAEFLDMDAPYTEGGRHVNAEHFAHEVYSYVRSPYKDLFVYDTVVQYEAPEGVSPPAVIEQSRRWRQPPSPKGNHDLSPTSEEGRTRARPRSSERSTSWSPSGRRYSSPTSPNNFHHPLANKGNDKSLPQPHKTLSGPSKGYRHHFNDLTDMRRSSHDDGYSGETVYSGTHTLLPSSSMTDVERNLSVSHFDVKGKRKASVTELDNSLVAAQAGTELEAVRQTSQTSTQYPQITDQKEISLSSKAPPRPPRNKSLLDSVKAHLAGNSGSSRGAATSRTLQRVSHDVLDLKNLSQESEAPASGVTTKVQVQNATVKEQALTGEATLRIDDRSKQSISIYLSQAGIKHHAINGTNDTVPPSSISPSISIDNQPSSTGTAKIGNSNTHLLAVVVDRESSHVLPTKEGNFLVGDVTSIKVDRSPPPRVNSQLHPVELRTRLLARLELEKSQASRVWKSSDVEKHSIKSPCDQRASATSVDFFTEGGAALDRVCDRKANASDSTSLKSRRRGQSDPDSASVSVAEEARAREAKLRLRAQLRVRLAAEKRHVDAG